MVRKTAILGLIFILFIVLVSPASALWNASYYETPILVNNTGNASILTDFQVSVNVTYNSNYMDANFTSFHLVNETSNTEMANRFWIDRNNSINGSYANMSLNLTTIPASAWDNTTYALYHRNVTEVDASNGTNTFIAWHGQASNSYLDSQIVSPGNIIFETYINTPAGAIDNRMGLSNNAVFSTDDSMFVGDYTNFFVSQVYNEGATVYLTGTTLSAGNHRLKQILAAGAVTAYVDGVQQGTSLTTNLPNELLGLGYQHVSGGITTQQWAFVRKYASPEPTAQLGATESPLIINISSWSNNYTNNQNLIIFVPQNTLINFNITTNIIPTYYNWTLNGIDQNRNADNFTLAASSLAGYIIAGSAYNSSTPSTDSKIWTISVTAPTYTSGEGRITSDTIFMLGNGANITILAPQNFTQIILFNSSETPPNTLQFLINGSRIRFNSSTHKNISNISYYPTQINSSRGWNFTINSGSGNTNVSANVTYPQMNYSIYNNSVFVARSTSNATGWLSYNISGIGNYSIQRVLGKPYLISPTNQSTQAITTLPYSQSFVWSNEASSQYNIQVAQDSGFSIIEADMNIADTQTSIGMWTTGTHYWRVRIYNGVATYGNWSEPFNFELTSSSLPSGDNSTGIQGIVYEIKSSGNIALSNARVTVWNSTWTDSTTTDSTGYYLFKNLTNISVYSLKTTKDNYEDSNTELVTTTNGTWKIKNIYMRACVSGFNCFYNQKYVNFIVKNPIGTEYSDVAISVYKGSATTTTYTGTTGDEGSWTELFLIGQEYRITFVKASQNINEEITITIPPKGQDDSYIILVWGTSTTKRTDNISWSLFTTDNNATTTFLNLSYLSNTTTTSLNFWVKNETGTLLFSNSTTNVTTWNIGFAVPDDSNLVYVWGFNASHPTWGNFTEGMVMRFKTQFLIDLHINDTRIYTWLSVGFLTLLSLLFSRTTNKYGYILVPLFSLFTWGAGWFPQGYQGSHFTLIMTALVIGVLAYMRASEKKGAYPY